jgi:hypothetical protein
VTPPAAGGRENFQNEFRSAILPARKVHRSQPHTSARSPSAVVPTIDHVEIARSPITQCSGST